MIKTIEIRFTSFPQPGDTFTYNLVIDGVPVIYPGGLTGVNKFYGLFSASPNGIMLGSGITTAINNTLSNLQFFNQYTGITYSVSGTSVFVTIQYNSSISITNVSDTPGRINLYANGEVGFTKNINEGELRKAFNNDTVEFFSTSTLEPLHCDVSAGTHFNIRLYPNPDKKFYFNFRPYITAIINTRNFQDTLHPRLNGSIASYIYNFTEGTYIELPVKFSIALEGGLVDLSTYNLAWFAGVEQLNDYNQFSVDDILLFSPFKHNTANKNYIKYWEGYPFDISIYNPGNTVLLRNSTTLFNCQFSTPGKISRIVFSDGRTDETLDTVFPMVEGFNQVRLMASETESVTDKFLTIEKMQYSCGIYLKWFNKYGGYSYWLFENTYSVDRSTKQLGELDRDLYNLEDTLGRSIQIGKESQDTIKIIAEMLTEDESRIVEGILDSPKIYMFTGRPFSQNSPKNWMEVSLKTGNTRIKNAKQHLTTFNFDIELPQRYTQTL